MNEEPYCREGEGHRCSCSPTGWCRVEMASKECALAKGCIRAVDESEQVAPI